MTAAVDKDGVLTLSDFKDLRGHRQKYRLVGKDLWQSEDQGRIFAIRDGSNRVVRLAFDFPGEQYERVPWYVNATWIGPTLLVCLGILGLVVIAQAIRIGRAIFLRKRPKWQPQPGTIYLTFAPEAAAWVWFWFVGSLLLVFVIMGDDMTPPTPDWFRWFTVVNWVTALGVLLSAFSVLRALLIWRRADLRRITKVKFALVGIACAFISLCAAYYHLIGPARRI